MVNFVPDEIRRFEKAETTKAKWRKVHEECYDYAIPFRSTFQEEGEGRDKHVEVYDSTAEDSAHKLVRRLSSALIPFGYNFLSFAPGESIPDEIKRDVAGQLEAYTKEFFRLLHRSNFYVEAPSSFYDLLVGTAALLVQSTDEKYTATFTAVPISELYINEEEVFRKHKMDPEVVEKTWEGANVVRPHEQAKDKKIEILESCIKTDSGVYEYKVFDKARNELLYYDTFRTSPWIVFRWSKVPGEVYGRGPIMSALPDIKTLNKTVEMVLKNAAIAISGVYTAADDGVLNPNLVEISPGTIIPVAFNGGVNGRSLDVLPRSGDFNVGDIVINDLRNSVKQKLFDTATAALDKTVRSAEEVRWRQKEELNMLGPVFTRIVFEFLEATVDRLVDLWASKGLLPKIEVDGQIVKIDHHSPIALSQDSEDIIKLLEAKEEIDILQPGLSSLVFNMSESANYILEKKGISPALTHPKQQVSEALSGVGQQVAQEGGLTQMVGGMTGGK